MEQKKTNNTTIKQHYIPRFILKRHLDNKEKINGYSKKENKFYKISTEGLCNKKYLYEMYNKEKEISFCLKNLIEKNLADMESNWEHLINNKIICQKELTNEDIDEIYNFCIIQCLRTEAMIEMGANVLVDYSNNELTLFQARNQYLLATLPTDHDKCTNKFYQKLHKPFENRMKKFKIHFLKSNNPFIFNEEMYFLDCNNEFLYYFPIASHLCIAIGNKYESYKLYEDISDEETININNYNFRYAKDRVYCCDKSILERCVNHYNKENDNNA